MYAIIITGGKQYKVSEGDVVRVEKLGLEDGEAVTFDQVLMISNENGLKVGSPLLANATVTGKVARVGKGRKIVIYKYKPKTTYHKKQGHRQPFTEVTIEKINA
ncbi:MAG: 50S ribosomal protein L21 [Firmicutes bacterium HGW-Firmicutes-1]|jgi:large subunit ribosomal protein L21|nr:MAG: 50S ribosomal protein L21 [Firmicutes bacterium HGW-Firmicutes-1]